MILRKYCMSYTDSSSNPEIKFLRLIVSEGIPKQSPFLNGSYIHSFYIDLCQPCTLRFFNHPRLKGKWSWVKSITYEIFLQGLERLTAPKPYKDSKTEISQKALFDFVTTVRILPWQQHFLDTMNEAASEGIPTLFEKHYTRRMYIKPGLLVDCLA